MLSLNMPGENPACTCSSASVTVHDQYASKKCFHFRSVPFLKTERNSMVGRMQSTARERSCVWSFHGYACARFREQTSSDVSLLVCSRKRARA